MTPATPLPPAGVSGEDCLSPNNSGAAHSGAAPADPFQLQRFVTAQSNTWQAALQELAAGQKRGHWMWFIFPQVAGLGSSPTAKRFAIASRAEAQAYLAHPVLGARLRDCADALLAVRGRTAEDIMGFPDFLKLQSCLTLFAETAPNEERFGELLEKYFHGRRDEKTLSFLARDEVPAE